MDGRGSSTHQSRLLILKLTFGKHIRMSISHVFTAYMFLFHLDYLLTRKPIFLTTLETGVLRTCFDPFICMYGCMFVCFYMSVGTCVYMGAYAPVRTWKPEESYLSYNHICVWVLRSEFQSSRLHNKCS